MSIKQVIFLTREQSFDITVYGLIPLSYHYLYFERNKVDDLKVKPLGKKLGDPLISDASGKLQFTYYYNADIQTDVPTEIETANKQAALVAGTKELVVTNINSMTLPYEFQNTSLSYWVGRIQVQVNMPTTFEDKTYHAPSGGGGGGDDRSFLGTGLFRTGSFFDW